MKKTIILSSIVALLCGCNPETWDLDITGMFCGSSPGIDTRIDDSFRYNEEHGFPVIFANDEEYKTYICTDTHVDTTCNYWKQFIYAYRADLDCLS